MSETQLKAQYKSALAELRKVLDREHQSLLLPAERYTGELRREKATLIRKCDELEAAKRRMISELDLLPGLRAKATRLEQVERDKEELEQRLRSLLALCRVEQLGSVVVHDGEDQWEISESTCLYLLTKCGKPFMSEMALVCFATEGTVDAFVRRFIPRSARQAVSVQPIKGVDEILKLCNFAQSIGSKGMKVVLEVRDGSVLYKCVDANEVLDAFQEPQCVVE